MSEDEQRSLAAKLATFPSGELAALLADRASHDEATARAIRWFLDRRDPPRLAHAIRQRIAGFKRRKHFLPGPEARKVAGELQEILDTIERDLIPVDPVLALQTLRKFIESDGDTAGHADDSNGFLGDAYRRACRLLGVASTAAGKPKEAETIFLALMESTALGTRDPLLEEIAHILSEEALQNLIAEWRLRLPFEDFYSPGGVALRLAVIAQSILDPELYEEVMLRGRPIDEFPLIALSLARIYLARGDPAMALNVVPSERVRAGYYEWTQLLIGIHRALGHTAEVAEFHWSDFARSASADHALTYLAAIPESEQPQARERIRQTVLQGQYTPLQKALYFAEMGDPATAADLVETASVPFDGDIYPPIQDLLELLEDDFPLAATILYRALLESILQRSQWRQYRYAVHYAERLTELVPSISDWKTIRPHADYWSWIRLTHPQKRKFWAQMKDARNS